jgi:hypothetical protein
MKILRQLFLHDRILKELKQLKQNPEPTEELIFGEPDLSYWPIREHTIQVSLEVRKRRKPLQDLLMVLHPSNAFAGVTLASHRVEF